MALYIDTNDNHMTFGGHTVYLCPDVASFATICPQEDTCYIYIYIYIYIYFFFRVTLTLFKFGNITKKERKKYIGTGLQLARLFEAGQAT